MSTTQAAGEPKFGIIAQDIGSVFAGTGVTITGNMGIGSVYLSDTISNHEILLKQIEAIEARLAIIEPNQALQDKYPGLQEAYEAYKIIEKMVK